MPRVDCQTRSAASPIDQPGSAEVLAESAQLEQPVRPEQLGLHGAEGRSRHRGAVGV